MAATAVLIIPAQMLAALCTQGQLPLVAGKPAVFFAGGAGNAAAVGIVKTAQMVVDAGGVGETVVAVIAYDGLFVLAGNRRVTAAAKYQWAGAIIYAL